MFKARTLSLQVHNDFNDLFTFISNQRMTIFFFTYDAAVGKINFDKDIYQLIYSETFCLKDAKNINLENKLSPQMIIF